MPLSRAPSPQSGLGGMPPPPGVHQDLDHPDTTLYKYNITCQVLCFTVVSTSVFVRLYAKMFIRRELKMEDYTCLLAWCFVTMLSALALACIRFRGGVHMWDVHPNDVESFLRIQYFGELLYYPGAFFTKTSILCLIARIFSPLRKVVILSRLLTVLMILYYVPAFFIKVFRCTPIRKTWNPDVRGHCITTEENIFVADCTISLITDLSILILPMPLVWRLNASLKRKLRIMTVFAGGILACAANIARTIQNYTLDMKDATYSVQIIMLWGIAEINVGLICSCLPIIPLFYLSVFRPQKSTHSPSSVLTYRRLEALPSSKALVSSTGGTGIERTTLSRVERAQAEAVVDEVARKQGLKAGNHEMEPNLASVVRRASPVEEGGLPWDGEGILKTVDVELTGISVPRRAILPREQAAPMDLGREV